MLTIRMLCDMETLNRQHQLPNTLVKFLEKTFKELHEALEPETDLACFLLERFHKND